MYFQTPFPLPSLKELSVEPLRSKTALLLHIFVAVAAFGVEGCPERLSGSLPNDQTINCHSFYFGHPKLHIRPTILVSLECAGPRQHNRTSVVFTYICCWFLSYSCFSCFYAGLVHRNMVLPLLKCMNQEQLYLENNSILRIVQFIKAQLVLLYTLVRTCTLK